MTSASNNVYASNLPDIVNKYNNIYHNTIKIKLVDVKSSAYLGFAIENNEKGRWCMNIKKKKKKILQNVTLQISFKKSCLIEKEKYR